jgi:hypothetical protein
LKHPENRYVETGNEGCVCALGEVEIAAVSVGVVAQSSV